MAEEVESFRDSRWEVQDIKVLAGWPAKPQTPCHLWSPGFTTLPFRAYAKRSLTASNNFLGDMRSWNQARRVNCTSTNDLRIYMVLASHSTTNPWHGKPTL